MNTMSDTEHKPAKKKSTLLRGKHGVRKRAQRPAEQADSSAVQTSTRVETTAVQDESLPEQWGWQEKMKMPKAVVLANASIVPVYAHRANRINRKISNKIQAKMLMSKHIRQPTH